MRCFRKKEETKEKVVYSYSMDYFAKAYTGLIEIDKRTRQAKMIKEADGEWNEIKARGCAETALVREGYPRRYTHSAS